MPSSKNPAAKAAAEEARKTPFIRVLYAEGGGYYADCTHCVWTTTGPSAYDLDELGVEHLREVHGIEDETQLQRELDRFAASRRT